METEEKRFSNDYSTKYAGFWRRFLASGVDGIIEVLIMLGLGFSLGVNPFDEVKTSIQTVNQVLSVIITAAFSILFWVNYDGATPGKKLMAIKVVHGDGKPVNYGVAFIRYVGYLISLVPLGLGYFWVAFDPKKQGWHDKIAGTYVVKTDKNPRTGLAIFLLILSTIVALSAFVVAVARDPEVKKAFEEGSKQESQKTSTIIDEREKENIQTYIPSSCGLSIPQPKTTDTYQGKNRKWVYEEVKIDPSGFDILDKDVNPVKEIDGNYLDYRDPNASLVDSKGLYRLQAGLEVFCADNIKSLTLDEYRSLALTNKKYKVTVEKDKVVNGEVEMVDILKEGKSPTTGNAIKEPAYLALSKDGKKLIYIKTWGFVDDKDPMVIRVVQQDLNLIIKNLKYR